MPSKAVLSISVTIVTLNVTLRVIKGHINDPQPEPQRFHLMPLTEISLLALLCAHIGQLNVACGGLGPDDGGHSGSSRCHRTHLLYQQGLRERDQLLLLLLLSLRVFVWTHL